MDAVEVEGEEVENVEVEKVKKRLSVEVVYLLLFYFYWGRRFARSEKGVTRDYYYSDYSFSVWQPWSFLAVALGCFSSGQCLCLALCGRLMRLKVDYPD